jgi:hypothetical protein
MTDAAKRPPKFPLQLDRLSKPMAAVPRPVQRPSVAHVEAARLMRPSGFGPDYRNGASAWSIGCAR